MDQVRERLGAAAHRHDFIAMALHDIASRIADVVIVVDNKDVASHLDNIASDDGAATVR